MMKSEDIDSECPVPFIRLCCISDKDSDSPACSWLPLVQDWSSRWCTMSKRYVTEGVADQILNLKTRDDDVFVVTFMKSGTTWTQELAWLLLNNLDYASAVKEYTMLRSPYLEISAFENFPGSIKAVEDERSPRLIKSHLPSQLLPIETWQKKRKVIYVARNPKDVIVSVYHFLKGLNLWNGDLDGLINSFLNDKIAFTPYWPHVIDFWRMRHEPNIFFVTFEDMKRDLTSVTERLCIFLGKNQLNETEMDQLLSHISFDHMKNCKYLNMTQFFGNIRDVREDFEFMRKGRMGGYTEELTSTQIEKINMWTCKNLTPYGLCESDIFGEI